MRRFFKLAPVCACFLAVSLPVMAEDATPTAQIGFSPDAKRASARELVLSLIDSATSSIRLIGYSFTARDITDALIRAKQRGVDVRVVLDEKENAKNTTSVRQIGRLISAGIPTRLDSYFPIQHDKAIVVDGSSTETGSFNFTESAERYNSENAVVIWHMPGLAQDMLAHWQSRWDYGHDIQPK